MPTPLLLLDGGMGHLLKLSRGESDFLGGALAPEATIREAHAAFLRSGCDVITTANFGVTPRGLERRSERSWGSGKSSSDEKDLEEITKRVARIAVRVAAEENRRRRKEEDEEEEGGGLRRRRKRRRVLVAGCLPPLGDNCYLPSRTSSEEASDIYERIAACLIDEGVDVLLAETCSCTADADAAATGVAAAFERAPAPRQRLPSSVPLWVSFTVDDDEPLRLRGGEEVEGAAARALRGGRGRVAASAVLVNCSTPAAISCALPALSRAVAEASSSSGGASSAGATVGCYANGFLESTTSWLGRGGLSVGPPPPPPPPALARGDGGREGDGDYDERGMIVPEAYARRAKEWVRLCVGGRGRGRGGRGRGGRGRGEALGSVVAAEDSPPPPPTSANRRPSAIVVGGCCGVGPEHIEALRRALDSEEEEGEEEEQGEEQEEEQREEKEAEER